jgi:transposase
MPWKECKPMDEKIRFVARALEGEPMAKLCREFGISRPTGYKLVNRYREVGIEGLEERSRRPYRHANKLPYQVERTIVSIRKKHPTWGATKIREILAREYSVIKAPAPSTIHAVLDRNGLITRRKRRRHKAEGTPLNHVTEPNALWCADYKGEFMLGNKRYGLPTVPMTRPGLKMRLFHRPRD